jgi:hypothetical protein
VKTARTLKFSVSAHTNRLWLYTMAGDSLGVNMTVDDVRGSVLVIYDLHSRGCYHPFPTPESRLEGSI